MQSKTTAGVYCKSTILESFELHSVLCWCARQDRARTNERSSGSSSPELRKNGERLKLRFNEGAPQCKLMTRKDSEKDSERPHYYSQFWLDVAAGRKIIGAPRSNDETDIEPEPELEPEPITLRKTGRSSETALSDGYEGTISHPEVEPELEAEEYVEPELDEVEVENNVEETDIPNMLVEETEIPDVDLAPLEEEEEFFDGEEEEEEDLEWGSGRGRKKPKPGRQQKQPKKIKRDRRGF